MKKNQNYKVVANAVINSKLEEDMIDGEEFSTSESRLEIKCGTLELALKYHLLLNEFIRRLNNPYAYLEVELYQIRSNEAVMLMGEGAEAEAGDYDEAKLQGEDVSWVDQETIESSKTYEEYARLEEQFVDDLNSKSIAALSKQFLGENKVEFEKFLRRFYKAYYNILEQEGYENACNVERLNNKYFPSNPIV